LDLASALDRHIFLDRGGVMGKLMYDLGNVYKTIPAPCFNSSKLFWALVAPPDRAETMANVSKADYDAAEKKVDAIIASLDSAQMECADAEIVKGEVRNTAAMLKLGAARGRWKLDAKSEDAKDLKSRFEKVIAEHRRLWLARNRPGGLTDRVSRLSDRAADLA
jgi:hypothetical protein